MQDSPSPPPHSSPSPTADDALPPVSPVEPLWGGALPESVTALLGQGVFPEVNTIDRDDGERLRLFLRRMQLDRGGGQMGRNQIVDFARLTMTPQEREELIPFTHHYQANEHGISGVRHPVLTEVMSRSSSVSTQYLEPSATGVSATLASSQLGSEERDSMPPELISGSWILYPKEETFQSSPSLRQQLVRKELRREGFSSGRDSSSSPVDYLPTAHQGKEVFHLPQRDDLVEGESSESFHSPLQRSHSMAEDSVHTASPENPHRLTSPEGLENVREDPPSVDAAHVSDAVPPRRRSTTKSPLEILKPSTNPSLSGEEEEEGRGAERTRRSSNQRIHRQSPSTEHHTSSAGHPLIEKGDFHEPQKGTDFKTKTRPTPHRLEKRHSGQGTAGGLHFRRESVAGRMRKEAETVFMQTRKPSDMSGIPLYDSASSDGSADTDGDQAVQKTHQNGANSGPLDTMHPVSRPAERQGIRIPKHRTKGDGSTQRSSVSKGSLDATQGPVGDHRRKAGLKRTSSGEVLGSQSGERASRGARASSAAVVSSAAKEDVNRPAKGGSACGNEANKEVPEGASDASSPARSELVEAGSREENEDEAAVLGKGSHHRHHRRKNFSSGGGPLDNSDVSPNAASSGAPLRSRPVISTTEPEENRKWAGGSPNSPSSALGSPDTGKLMKPEDRQREERRSPVSSSSPADITSRYQTRGKGSSPTNAHSRKDGGRTKGSKDEEHRRLSKDEEHRGMRVSKDKEHRRVSKDEEHRGMRVSKDKEHRRGSKDKEHRSVSKDKEHRGVSKDGGFRGTRATIGEDDGSEGRSNERQSLGSGTGVLREKRRSASFRRSPTGEKNASQQGGGRRRDPEESGSPLPNRFSTTNPTRGSPTASKRPERVEQPSGSRSGFSDAHGYGEDSASSFSANKAIQDNRRSKTRVEQPSPSLKSPSHGSSRSPAHPSSSGRALLDPHPPDALLVSPSSPTDGRLSGPPFPSLDDKDRFTSSSDRHSQGRRSSSTPTRPHSRSPCLEESSAVGFQTEKDGRRQKATPPQTEERPRSGGTGKPMYRLPSSKHLGKYSPHIAQQGDYTDREESSTSTGTQGGDGKAQAHVIPSRSGTSAKEVGRRQTRSGSSSLSSSTSSGSGSPHQSPQRRNRSASNGVGSRSSHRDQTEGGGAHCASRSRYPHSAGSSRSSSSRSSEKDGQRRTRHQKDDSKQSSKRHRSKRDGSRRHGGHWHQKRHRHSKKSRKHGHTKTHQRSHQPGEVEKYYAMLLRQREIDERAALTAIRHDIERLTEQIARMGGQGALGIPSYGVPTASLSEAAALLAAAGGIAGKVIPAEDSFFLFPLDPSQQPGAEEDFRGAHLGVPAVHFPLPSPLAQGGASGHTAYDWEDLQTLQGEIHTLTQEVECHLEEQQAQSSATALAIAGYTPEEQALILHAKEQAFGAATNTGGSILDVLKSLLATLEKDSSASRRSSGLYASAFHPVHSGRGSLHHDRSNSTAHHRDVNPPPPGSIPRRVNPYTNQIKEALEQLRKEFHAAQEKGRETWARIEQQLKEDEQRHQERLEALKAKALAKHRAPRRQSSGKKKRTPNNSAKRSPKLSMALGSPATPPLPHHPRPEAGGFVRRKDFMQTPPSANRHRTHSPRLPGSLGSARLRANILPDGMWVGRPRHLGGAPRSPSAEPKKDPPSRGAGLWVQIPPDILSEGVAEPPQRQLSASSHRHPGSRTSFVDPPPVRAESTPQEIVRLWAAPSVASSTAPDAFYSAAATPKLTHFNDSVVSKRGWRKREDASTSIPPQPVQVEKARSVTYSNPSPRPSTIAVDRCESETSPFMRSASSQPRQPALLSAPSHSYEASSPSAAQTPEPLSIEKQHSQSHPPLSRPTSRLEQPSSSQPPRLAFETVDISDASHSLVQTPEPLEMSQCDPLHRRPSSGNAKLHPVASTASASPAPVLGPLSTYDRQDSERNPTAARSPTPQQRLEALQRELRATKTQLQQTKQELQQHKARHPLHSKRLALRRQRKIQQDLLDKVYQRRKHMATREERQLMEEVERATDKKKAVERDLVRRTNECQWRERSPPLPQEEHETLEQTRLEVQACEARLSAAKKMLTAHRRGMASGSVNARSPASTASAASVAKVEKEAQGLHTQLLNVDAALQNIESELDADPPYRAKEKQLHVLEYRQQTRVQQLEEEMVALCHAMGLDPALFLSPDLPSSDSQGSSSSSSYYAYYGIPPPTPPSPLASDSTGPSSLSMSSHARDTASTSPPPRPLVRPPPPPPPAGDTTRWSHRMVLTPRLEEGVTGGIPSAEVIWVFPDGHLTGEAQLENAVSLSTMEALQGRHLRGSGPMLTHSRRPLQRHHRVDDSDPTTMWVERSSGDSSSPSMEFEVTERR